MMTFKISRVSNYNRKEKVETIFVSRGTFKRFQSISVQLFIIFIIGILVPLLLGGYLSYNKSVQLIEEQVSKVATETITQVRDKIFLLYNKLDDMSMMILYNYEIHHILERDLEKEEKMQANKNAIRYINSISVNSPEILDIYIFDHLRQNSIYSSDNSTLINQWESDWYGKIMEADGEAVWFGLSHNSYLKGMNMGSPVYALGRAIKSFKNGEIIGIIFIEVRGFALIEELTNIKFGETGSIHVVDEQNRYVYHPDKQLYGETSSYTFTDSNYLQNERKEGVLTIPNRLKNGWTVMGVVPVNELTTDSKEIRNFTFWIALGSILLALAMGYYVTRKIGRPLVNLSRLMKRGESGDLRVRSTISGNNEISHLSNSFNRMLQQIEILITQIEEKESQKKIAEIRALRYQINPHFLYNTLNSIRWMAKLNRSEEVANAITTLVHLLEASLERNGTFVKLGDELQLLEKYMIIQQYRYDFNIELKINCSAELRDIEIPRMLLQPIIENAIFHGIAPKDEEGIIEIEVSQNNRDIVIDIIDDGIGILDEKIPHLLTIESDTKPRGMTSIGLRHVHQTLQWFYGKEYGVEMNSIKSVGTKVRITFSKTRGDQHVQGSVS